VAIGDARAADYDVAYFCGGTQYYGKGGSHASEAKELIDEALAAGRTVAAIGKAPVILADGGFLDGRSATCSRWGTPPGEFIAMLEAGGAQWVDASVVEDDQFVTARDPEDVNELIAAILTRLVARARASPSDRGG
jgi:putative intracellular protease/amidase